MLATGGFDFNPDMVKANLSYPMYVSCASVNNTGDGQRMGASIGASLERMDGSWGVPSYIPTPFDPSMPMLNDYMGPDWGLTREMSGSPIIQDGRLVGAVTHVLVNDPTRGYGILIENMLDAAAYNSAGGSLPPALLYAMCYNK